MSGTPVLTIKIMPPPPSPNKLMRMSYFKRHRIFLDIYWQVCGSLRYRQLSFSGRVAITAERFSRRKLDPDNLIGSLKPVIDGLRHCGVIADDTDKYVRLGAIRQAGLNKGVAYLVVHVSPDESDEDQRERELARDFLVPLLDVT